MIRSSGARLLAATAAITLIDAVWIGVRASDRRVRDDFARATCGLGLGAAVGPDWSFFDVDPRLSASCDGEIFPLPGIACPDPSHGTGVQSIPARK